ncbi:MAG TPA: hypothetical protein VKW09_06775 [bacterium]|nr:hypothetical protein [bacterium]
MAVPTAAQPLTDRQGRPIAIGDKVRAPGLDGPAVVQEVDARYGTVIVLVAGRANQQMGRMLRTDMVERV